VTARDLAERAAQLRAGFDRSFAEPLPGAPPVTRELLRVRLAGEAYALELADIATIHVDVEIVAVPATAPELLGVIAVRAQIVPAFDLRAVLGLARELPPRWLVVARDAPAAFAFDGFDGLVRTAEVPVASAAAFSRGAVAQDGRMVSILDLAAVCAAVRKE